MRSGKGIYIAWSVFIFIILGTVFPVLGKILVYGAVILFFVFMIGYHFIPSRFFDPPKRNRIKDIDSKEENN